jgi:uncharacterized protein (TIGR02996 family)
MHDEAGFLSAIREAPADDTARLVFADWLDEQDEPLCTTKSAFIRLELQMSDVPVEAPADSTRSLRRLAFSIPDDWLVTVSRPKIVPCMRCTKLPCPEYWHLLSPTPLTGLRRCEPCNHVVRFCTTAAEAKRWRSCGMNVVVSPKGLREPRTLRLTPEMIERLRNSRREGDIVRTPPSPQPPSPPPPPPPPLVIEWLPVPNRSRSNRKTKRKRGRGNNRNIQRDIWEEVE